MYELVLTACQSVPADIVALPPRETELPLSVIAEFVNEPLAIFESVLLEPLIVLLVSVSVDVLAT